MRHNSLDFVFQSTLPARGATVLTSDFANIERFQSTLPARGATRVSGGTKPVPRISIHAPRTGSDARFVNRHAVRLISIHAPRTGSDPKPPHPLLPHPQFQSTLPARGATARCKMYCMLPADFNPRSPHGERLPAFCLHFPTAHFNPRSPHGERQPDGGLYVGIVRFQSTLPARGATKSSTR